MVKGKTDAEQQKGEDSKSSLVWGCGQMGDSLALCSLSFWCGWRLHSSVQNVN